MGKKARLEAALSEGMNALIAGNHISSNPYVINRAAHEQWEKGFRYAAEKQRKEVSALVGGDLVNERLAAQLMIYEGSGRQPVAGDKPIIPAVGWACEGYAIAKSGNESYVPADPPTFQDVCRAVGFVAFRDYGEAIDDFLMYRKELGEWELAFNTRVIPPVRGEPAEMAVIDQPSFERANAGS